MITIISIISMIGVCIGTAALIIVLSFFNGFEGLVVSLYNSFDPDLRITILKGKTFDENQIPIEEIKELEGVRYVTKVLEENALLKYKEKQYIATIKGVDENYTKASGLDTMLIDGEFTLSQHGYPFAVMGFGVAHNLSLEMHDIANPISMFVPGKGEASVLNPEGAFNESAILPSGIFSIQHEFDSKYVITALDFIRNLLGAPNEISALEIKLQDGIEPEKVQERVKNLVGDQFEVKNRFEQRAILYKIMKSEKWAVYFILSFILLIATFNMVGSLTMLVLDKNRDIVVLRSMGASIQIIKKIFLMEGIFIAAIGAMSGMLIGFIVCLLQGYYNFIPLNTSGAFVVDSYPVKIEALDFFYVFITVMAISLFAISFPLRKLSQENLNVALLRGE